MLTGLSFQNGSAEAWATPVVTHTDGAGDGIRNMLLSFLRTVRWEELKAAWWTRAGFEILLMKQWYLTSQLETDNCRLLRWINLKDPQRHLSRYCYKSQLLTEVCLGNDEEEPHNWHSVRCFGGTRSPLLSWWDICLFWQIAWL